MDTVGMQAKLKHQKPYAQRMKQWLGTQSRWVQRCCCSDRQNKHQKRPLASPTASSTNWHWQYQRRTPQIGSPLQNWRRWYFSETFSFKPVFQFKTKLPLKHPHCRSTTRKWQQGSEPRTKMREWQKDMDCADPPYMQLCKLERTHMNVFSSTTVR